MFFERNAFAAAILFVLIGLVSFPDKTLPLTGSGAVAAATPESGKPAYSAYKTVTIGMKTDDARKALGNPKDKADDQDLYVFSDEELVQIYYDANKQVSAISITYYKDFSKAPSVRDVLGEDVPAKPDGSIFKLVRFTKAGYSASYSKTAGDSASVSITLQKL